MTTQATPQTRRVRYQVAASLDGFIAGPNGEADWIVMDPDIDFGALFAQFDTLLMGRRTFEGVVAQGNAGAGGAFGMKTVVVSRTLKADDHPGVTVIGGDIATAVTALRAQPGKDIWLFGGGDLFRSCLVAGVVDTVEIAVVPILLGGGIPMLPTSSARVPLTLTRQQHYQMSGIMLLEYAVQRHS
jgi:dihydrofolate reductase